MYVLACPCIQNPKLRAKGITTPNDLVLFERCIERCKQFGIEMVPLPCPETVYLGSERDPCTFLEHLDTPAFARLLDTLEVQAKEIIRQRSKPLCILGVNSSPTCGVTSTYYGCVGNESPKRDGRGVFLSRFAGIRAVDVAEFAQYRIYLAAPLFSEAERTYNSSLSDLLREHLFEVYLPQETGDDTGTRTQAEQARIFSKNKEALDNADIVVAVIDGADADSGTAWEMGYAHARQKPVIAIRTDFRRTGTHEQVNLMLEESSVVISSPMQLPEAVKSPLCWRSDT